MISKGYALFVSLVLILLAHSVSGNIPNEESERKVALSANCSHVELLSRSSPKLNEKVDPEYIASIIGPGPNQTSVARMALDALPPFVCKAVNNIVFVNRANGNAMAFVDPDFPATIHVIATSGLASEEKLKGSDMPSFQDQEAQTVIPTKLVIWPQTVKAIIHEAIHSAVHLLQSVNDEPFFIDFSYKPVWSSDATAHAERIVGDNLLKLDLGNDWERINLQFANAKWSERYPSKEDAKNVLEDPAQEPSTGFMSVYASKTAGEDIAESAAWPIFMLAYEDKKAIRLGNMPNIEVGTFLEFGDNANLVPPWNYVNACKDLSATDSRGIPGKLAAVYLKLNFLLDLEIITREAFDKCIGSGKIGLLRKGDNAIGFQSFEGANREFSREYTGDPKIAVSGDWSVAKAIGRVKWVKEYDAEIHLQIKSGASNGGLPRGTWKIEFPCDQLAKLRWRSEEARFFVRIPETRTDFLLACEAYIYVLRSKKTRLEGSVVMFKYFKGIVPESLKDGILFTFLIKQ